MLLEVRSSRADQIRFRVDGGVALPHDHLAPGTSFLSKHTSIKNNVCQYPSTGLLQSVCEISLEEGPHETLPCLLVGRELSLIRKLTISPSLPSASPPASASLGYSDAEP